MPASSEPAVGVDVLGELRVHVDDVDAELGGPLPQALVAALAVAAGRVVGADALVEALWDDPPANAPASVHGYVSRLRRALGPAGPVLERRGTGYRLALPAEAFDWCRFEELADRGQQALESSRPHDAHRLLLAAEDLWRGPVLAGLPRRRLAEGLAARLDERREGVRASRLEADLQLGRHTAVLGELEEAVRVRPLDEARWGRLALARYRSGQQAEALAALAEARRTLVDELGVEPGQALRDLELAVLRQDPALEAGRVTTTAAGEPAAEVRPDVAATGSLVGRDGELASLIAALDDSVDGAVFAVLEGEPGIGKTRLAEEVAEHAAARGALVLWGRSNESGAAPAFWPWLPVLRALRALDPDGAEEGLDALLDARGGDAHPAGLFAGLDAVALAVRRTSASRHLVVLLDDLQWADSASLELIGYLATHLTDEPVLVLATVRDVAAEQRDDLLGALSDIARRRGSRRLRLRGLDAESTAALVRQTAQREVGAEVQRTVDERAEGNPFFVTELTRLLAGSATGALPDVVPAGVRDVVRQRLSGLPDETDALLQVCAVIGRVVDLRLLPIVSGLPVATCLARLEPAVRLRLLAPLPGGSTGLHFAHALVREVVVEDLSALRRLQIHLQVADALEDAGDDDDAELLAEHLHAAVPLGVGQRAAAALERAAEVAVRRFALRSAADLLDRAVALRRAAGTSDSHALAELHAIVRLTSVQRALQGWGGVEELLERGQRLAARLGRDDVERELAWARWGMADTSCDFATAEPIATRFAALAERTDDPALQELGLSVWGIQCWHAGRIVEARRALDASYEAGQRVVDTSPAQAALLSYRDERVLLSHAFRLAVQELMEDAQGVREQFDAMAEGLDPFARSMLAVVACHAPTVAGDVERVRAWATSTVATDADGLLSFWGGLARMHLGWVLLCDGELDRGFALWEEGRKIFTSVGSRTGLPAYLANTAIALLAAGEVERGADLAAQARQELELYREMWNEPIVLLAEAEATAAQGGDPSALLAQALASAQARSMAGAARRIEAAARRLV